MTPKALSAEDLATAMSESLSENHAIAVAAARRVAAHIAALEADNAALRLVGKEVVDTWVSTKTPVSQADDRRMALAVSRVLTALDLHGPGAALLERHEKEVAELKAEVAKQIRSVQNLVGDSYRLALVRARNEGRTDAIAEIRRAKAKAPAGSMAHSLLLLAEEAACAMKEPEQ